MQDIAIPAIDEDAEYQLLLDRLNEQFPPVGKGLDLKEIKGNFHGRTAKAIVLHLSLCGWSVSELAEAINAHPETINKYLCEAIREATPLDDLEVIRTHELLKTNTLEQMCHKQFDRGCEDNVTIRETLDKDGNVHELKTTHAQSGNPAYIRAITELAKHRDRLLGLAVPTKIEVDKTEKRLIITEIIVRSREEAEAARAAGLLKAPEVK